LIQKNNQSGGSQSDQNLKNLTEKWRGAGQAAAELLWSFSSSSVTVDTFNQTGFENGFSNWGYVEEIAARVDEDEDGEEDLPELKDCHRVVSTRHRIENYMPSEKSQINIDSKEEFKWNACFSQNLSF